MQVHHMKARRWSLGIAGSLLSLSALAGQARAEWEPPKDGVVTEKQVAGYLQMTREIMQALKASGKAVEASGNNAAAAMAIYANTDARFKAALAKTGMTEAESRWVGERVWEARSSLMMQEVVTNAKAQMADAAKKNAADQSAAKAKVAAYEAAVKSGRKVLSADDRKSIVESAKGDETSALADAKSHDDEAAAATAEAAKSDAAAKAADALAAKPPADISADDRPGYVDDRKREAESARSAAAEQRTKVADERKQSAEYKAKAAAAAAKGKNPEVASAEEAADVKKANEDGLASAKAEVEGLAEAAKLLADGTAQMEKSFAAQGNQAPKPNVDLVRKRKDEMDSIFTGK